jgi:GxxExxY protein
MTANLVARQIVDSAFRVHVSLGPGLLESVYVAVLSNELSKRGLQVATQQAVPLVYEGLDLQISFRADMIVQEKVIVEVKSVEAIALVHKMQLLTYLRLADKRLGLLINFNVTLIKDGITHVVNGLTDSD